MRNYTRKKDHQWNISSFIRSNKIESPMMWLNLEPVIQSEIKSEREKQILHIEVRVAQSCPALCDPMDYTVHGILQARMLESLLQGIFPTQGWNPGLLHCRRIPYHLSHQGSPRDKLIYINTCMWNLKKWYWWTYLQSRNRDADGENRFVDSGMGERREWDELR